MKQRKGTLTTVIGVILIILQIMSVVGNVKNGQSFHLSFESFGQLIGNIVGLIAYFLPGIIGIILISAGSKKKKEQATVRAHQIENAYIRKPTTNATPPCPTPARKDDTPPINTPPIQVQKEVVPKPEDPRTEISLPQDDFLSKFNALDERDKAAVLNALEQEYTRAYKK